MIAHVGQPCTIEKLIEASAYMEGSERPAHKVRKHQRSPGVALPCWPQRLTFFQLALQVLAQSCCYGPKKGDGPMGPKGLGSVEREGPIEPLKSPLDTEGSRVNTEAFGQLPHNILRLILRHGSRLCLAPKASLGCPLAVAGVFANLVKTLLARRCQWISNHWNVVRLDFARTQRITGSMAESGAFAKGTGVG